MSGSFTGPPAEEWRSAASQLFPAAWAAFREHYGGSMFYDTRDFWCVFLTGFTAGEASKCE